MCFSCEEFVQVLAVFLSLLFCLLCVCVCGLHCRRSWICLGYQSFVRWVFYKYFLRVCFLFIFLTVSLDEQKCVSLIKSHLSVFSFIVIAYCELRQFCLTPEVMKVISFVSSKTFCFFANLYLGLWYISKKVFRFFFFFIWFCLHFIEMSLLSSLDCFGETSPGCRSGLYFRNLYSVTLICLSLYHCHIVSVICNFIGSLEIRFLSPSIFSLFLDCFAKSLGLPYTVLIFAFVFLKKADGIMTAVALIYRSVWGELTCWQC